MPVDLNGIKGRYLQDLLAQPKALEDTFAALERSKSLADLALRLNRGKFQRVVLTGMGSSFHALHSLNLQLIARGMTPIMVETSELIHYQTRLLGPKTLVVAVSQSGQSAETVRLLEINRKRSPIIAVTNTADSPLAKKATAALITHAGIEFSVSCKTYVSALMALKWLEDILSKRSAVQSRRELKSAAPEFATYLSNWQRHVQELTAILENIRRLFFVGRGASLSAVGTGGLVVKESDHFHAEGMSSAAFRHGPLEMLNNETAVIIFSGDAKARDLNQRLFTDIQNAGGRAHLIGPTSSEACFRIPDHGDGVRPILEILPVQMITLALAALAGREPGKFDRASKITATE